MIHRIIAGMEGNPPCRDNLRSEVALTLCCPAPSWRQASFMRTFVARVTHNVSVSHVQQAIRVPKQDALSDTVQDEAAIADDTLARADLGRRLQVAVARLPNGLRKVVTLHLEDCSAREIAETLGVSEGA